MARIVHLLLMSRPVYRLHVHLKPMWMLRTETSCPSLYSHLTKHSSVSLLKFKRAPSCSFKSVNCMLFSQWIVCRAFKKLENWELKLFQASSDVDIPHFITDFPELSQGHFLYSLAWNSQVFLYAWVYEDPYHLIHSPFFFLLHAFL